MQFILYFERIYSLFKLAKLLVFENSLKSRMLDEELILVIDEGCTFPCIGRRRTSCMCNSEFWVDLAGCLQYSIQFLSIHSHYGSYHNIEPFQWSESISGIYSKGPILHYVYIYHYYTWCIFFNFRLHDVYGHQVISSGFWFKKHFVGLRILSPGTLVWCKNNQLVL